MFHRALRAVAVAALVLAGAPAAHAAPWPVTPGIRAALRFGPAGLGADTPVEAAARELGVHANTLRHRLARAEETTGASLRCAESLAEVRWALTADAQSVS